MRTHLLWAVLHFIPSASDTTLAGRVFTAEIFSAKYWLAEEIAWRVTVGELYLAGVFIEREIWSTLQRNLLPVKWRPCFSAEIWRIFLQTVIPNDWYYGLPFLFCCSAWLQCVRDKKKAHIICHCVAGVLTGNERPNKIRFGVSRDCFGSVLKNEGYQGSLFLLHWPSLSRLHAQYV